MIKNLLVKARWLRSVLKAVKKKLGWSTIFHELKSVVKAKIAQNNTRVSERGITVKIPFMNWLFEKWTRLTSVANPGGYGGPQLSRQNQKPHGKNKIPHGKTENLTVKPKTSRQKQNTSRQNQNLTIFLLLPRPFLLSPSPSPSGTLWTRSRLPRA